MSKTRKVKRKAPVTATHTPRTSSSNKPAATRAVIRRFHVLQKRQAQLRRALSRGGTSSDGRDAQRELADIERQMAALGGLEAYQKMSAIGQGDDRGGGSEKILLEFLGELDIPKKLPKGEIWKVLEVGALKPDNYASCTSWMNVTPIDLHSRHSAILEQDFLKMDEETNREHWDLISLSLVVNFVPDLRDRGRMLRLAYAMLRPDKLLFLALPLPCVTNSRYMTPEHLTGLMQALSFVQVKSRWKEGGINYDTFGHQWIQIIVPSVFISRHGYG
ncbi:hypothetical protein NM688_g3012 [Phlebia brevispora]|uniref:Uncharacterized protein n=1 Tax=Phlebia brevispora TaxID=194682 RepID=A0ACC1T6R3_9APHY|nr:hypothetical protein NM688_g3012 [Phlebia brevispora]